jgi:hypothetical protein
MIRVIFTEVGPRKLSWEAQTETLTYSWLMKQIRAKRALMSRGVDFDEETGGIYVGGFRRVGSFQIITDVAACGTVEGGK